MRNHMKMRHQTSFNFVGILCVICLVTPAVLSSTVTPSSVSRTLEYDCGFQGQYALGNPIPAALSKLATGVKDDKQPVRVAIVGGGIAGLSTAYYLQNNTRLGNSTQFTIFEREARIGGRIRTAQVYDSGSDIDTGGYTFDTDDELLKELAQTIDVPTQKVFIEQEMFIWAAARARPGPNEAELRHFARKNSINLKPQSFTLLGNGDMVSKLVNHVGRDDVFSLKLESEVTRIEKEQDFRVYWTKKSDSGLTRTYSEGFDYVVIATPFSQSQIEISPAPSVAPQEATYEPLHVTHFISQKKLDPQTFNLPRDSEVPRVIWNSRKTDGDLASSAPDFLSMTKEYSDIMDGCLIYSEPLYRVISREEFADSDIATLFMKCGRPRRDVKFPDQSCEKLRQVNGYAIGEVVDESELMARREEDRKMRRPGCVSNPDIKWLHREFWPKGMPVIEQNMSISEQYEQMELAPGLFYVSGFEASQGASISKSVWNARRASDLLTERYRHRHEANSLSDAE